MGIGDLLVLSFNVIYLLFAWIMILIMFFERKIIFIEHYASATRFFWGFLLLALGDVPLLVLQIMTYLNVEEAPNSILVGFAALSPMITLSLLYMLILHGYYLIFKRPIDAIFFLLIVAGFLGFLLFIPEENLWGNVVPPADWGPLRTIPLLIQGLGVATLMLWDGVHKNHKIVKRMGFCILVSIAFYVSEILLIHDIPLLRLLIIPRFILYMALIFITFKGFWSSKKE
jgi:hypothetical protein